MSIIEEIKEGIRTAILGETETSNEFRGRIIIKLYNISYITDVFSTYNRITLTNIRSKEDNLYIEIYISHKKVWEMKNITSADITITFRDPRSIDASLRIQHMGIFNFITIRYDGYVKVSTTKEYGKIYVDIKGGET